MLLTASKPQPKEMFVAMLGIVSIIWSIYLVLEKPATKVNQIFFHALLLVGLLLLAKVFLAFL